MLEPITPVPIQPIRVFPGAIVGSDIAIESLSERVEKMARMRSIPDLPGEVTRSAGLLIPARNAVILTNGQFSTARGHVHSRGVVIPAF